MKLLRNLWLLLSLACLMGVAGCSNNSGTGEVKSDTTPPNSSTATMKSTAPTGAAKVQAQKPESQ